MDNNQQQNGKQIPLIIDAVPDEVPDDPGQHPSAAKTQTIWERLMGAFADGSRRFAKDHVSKHAGGRIKSKSWRAKRKTRRQMARASRKINRGK